MSSSTSVFKEVLPKTGQLYQEDIPNLVLCKPKLLPLKSVTLEKLEQMQKDAQVLYYSHHIVMNAIAIKRLVRSPNILKFVPSHCRKP